MKLKDLFFTPVNKTGVLKLRLVALGSFVTDGLTVVSVLDGGRVRESFEGTDAVSQSSLDTVTLERSAGVVLINLKDGKTEVYGGGRP